MSRLEDLRRLAQAEPNDPLAHYALALEHLNLEQWDAAVTAFDKTLEIDANYTAAYYHKARAEIRAGRRDAAKATLDSGMRCARASGDMKTEREMRELWETT